MPEINDWNDERPRFLDLSELQDGDVVVFDNEGRLVDDRWGVNRLQMDIILPNKEIRRITVNRTSQKNLISRFGKATIDWVNQPVVIRKEKLLIGGRQKEALILYPE